MLIHRLPHPARLLRVAMLLALLPVQGLLAQEEGLFAVFTVGGAVSGEFRCQLHYDKTPRTVANFVGLATGEQTWLDYKTGLLRSDPFFDGIIFHRVIKGFMVQAGSPNAIGNDSPGYSFEDEFDASLRHSEAGILSMANAGANTNGSQFFITLGEEDHLNGIHSVFGKVVDGLQLVQQIGGLPTETNALGTDRLVNEVRIESVRIERIGAAAQAFDVGAHGLPILRPATLAWEAGARGSALELSAVSRNFYEVLHSEGLQDWEPASRAIGSGQGGHKRILPELAEIATSTGSHFFRAIASEYATDLKAADSVAGKTLALIYENQGSLIIYLNFTAVDGGTYRTANLTGGDITDGEIGYYYEPGPLSSFLGLGFSNGLPQQSMRLMFETPTSGTFRGSFSGGNLSGTFTLQPTE